MSNDEIKSKGNSYRKFCWGRIRKKKATIRNCLVEGNLQNYDVMLPLPCSLSVLCEEDDITDWDIDGNFRQKFRKSEELTCSGEAENGLKKREVTEWPENKGLSFVIINL